METLFQIFWVDIRRLKSNTLADTAIESHQVRWGLHQPVFVLTYNAYWFIVMRPLILLEIGVQVISARSLPFFYYSVISRL